MLGLVDLVRRQFGWHQVKVGSVSGHHRTLSRVIDEYCDRPSRVSFGLDEVKDDAFLVEILAGELSEPVSADFADEASRSPASARPDSHIGSTASRSEEHLAEGVATSEQFCIGANENIPGEVTENAQRCR